MNWFHRRPKPPETHLWQEPDHRTLNVVMAVQEQVDLLREATAELQQAVKEAKRELRRTKNA